MNLQEALDQSFSPVSFHDIEGRPLGTGEYGTAQDVIAEAQRLQANLIAVMTGHGMRYHYFDGTGRPVPIEEGVFSVPDELYTRLHAHLPTLVRMEEAMPTKVKYRGEVYRVLQRGYLGDQSLYKLASNVGDGAPFGAKVDECEVVESTAQPVQEQAGPDLARRLQPALDKLDSAASTVRSVMPDAPHPAKETLDRAESMIFEAYGRVQRGQSQLLQASARPVQEQMHVHRRLDDGLGKLHEVQGLLQSVISVTGSVPSASRSHFQAAIELVGRAAGAMNQGLASGVWEAARPVDAARPRREQMLCDNASRKGMGRGIALSPQCYDSPATQSVTLDQDGEIENFDLCDACTRALKRSARQQGYHVTSKKL